METAMLSTDLIHIVSSFLHMISGVLSHALTNVTGITSIPHFMADLKWQESPHPYSFWTDTMFPNTPRPFLWDYECAVWDWAWNTFPEVCTCIAAIVVMLIGTCAGDTQEKVLRNRLMHGVSDKELFRIAATKYTTGIAVNPREKAWDDDSAFIHATTSWFSFGGPRDPRVWSLEGICTMFLGLVFGGGALIIFIVICDAGFTFIRAFPACIIHSFLM